MNEETTQKALALLKRFYGYDSFRPLQLDIIGRAVEGRDQLVLMPTGGGKSICYQIPALLFDSGITIVVSPLIALMTDQVEGLMANGIPAAAIHSNQTEAENRTIAEMAFRGRIKLLYISPERLNLEIERWNSMMNVRMIAIDEAHCISQWGHDFRPEYTQLARLKEQYPDAPIMALTATADRTTREDIVKQLALTDPAVSISSFDRPNISLNVISGSKKKEKIDTIARLCKKYPGDSGIVYCMSRKAAENMAAGLRQKGLNALFYHAGMKAEERKFVQQRFINGDVPIVCATVAFGMGIDKSNIRWVVHNNLPQSIENYYQEIGRAGRDGLPAEAVLFYSVADLITLERFVAESGRQKLNTEKLQRMRDYADASVCRRRILLSYFNETIDHDCGNCDVCLDPPQRTDATVEIQMALSAIVRTDGKAGISTLIDILRGSARADIIAKGYNRLKTYGVGRHFSFQQWNHYLTQMVQLGLIDIRYSDGGTTFGVTDYGRSVLFGGTKVMLTPYTPRTAVRKPEAARTERSSSAKSDQLLLSQLKALRLGISRSLGIPAYLVFSDRTLAELATAKPTDRESFGNVQGIGEKKMARWWKPFVNAVRRHLGMSEFADDDKREKAIIGALQQTDTPAAAAESLGMEVIDLNREVAAMIDADRFNEFRLVISREEFAQIMELNRRLGEADFRREIRSRFTPGLDTVAMAMASYMLRHRNE